MTNHTPPGQAPQFPESAPDVLFHVCFGGCAECSGCNPDPQCQSILHTVATRQGLTAVFVAMGMPQQEIQNAVEFAMPHYESGYASGMARLHEGMRTDPYLRSQLHVSALRAQPAAAQQPVAPPMIPPSFQPYGPPQPRIPSPYAPVQTQAPAHPQMPYAPPAPGGESKAVLGSIFESARQAPPEAPPLEPLPPGILTAASERRSPPQQPEPKVRAMARPMTAEEIATAGHVLPDMTEEVLSPAAPLSDA